MKTQEDKIHIVVCGIGGIGGYYGGLLAALAQTPSGRDIQVDFVARAGEHLNKIRRNGLMIETPHEGFIVRPHSITARPADLPKAHYILLATKSYDLTESIRSIHPLLTPGTIIIPLLNGLDVYDTLSSNLPKDVILWGGCAFITVRKAAPGLIRSESTIEGIVIGDRQRSIGAEKTGAEQQLEDIMKRAGINVLVPDDVMGEVRKKFLMISNAAAATAYFDCNAEDILSKHREFLIGLTEELVDLYRAQGFVVEDDAVASALNRIDRMPKKSTTSMHSDLSKGQTSELESLVGYVVRCSDEYHLPAKHYREAYRGILERIQR